MISKRVSNNKVKQVSKDNRVKVKSLRRMMNDPMVDMGLTPDLKAIDTFISFSPISTTTGSIVVLNFPSYGTGYNQRVGDRIRIINLEYRSQTNITGGDYVDTVRSILVQENGESVGTPTALSILQPTSGDTFTFAPYMYNVRNIYTPLYDTFQALSAAGSNAIRTNEFSITPKIQDIRFISGGTVPYSGALYFMYLSNYSSAATYVNAFLRLWFIDH